MLVQIAEPANGTVWLGGAFDARLGMALDFLPDGSGLAVTLSEPTAADTTMAITYNPLPQFFGLQAGGVEVSRAGEFLSLYANLTPAP